MAAVQLKIANKPLSTNPRCCWLNYRCPEWMPGDGWFEADNLFLYVQILPQCISHFRLVINLLRKKADNFNDRENATRRRNTVGELSDVIPQLFAHSQTNHTDQSQTNHSAQVTENHVCSRSRVLQDDNTPSVSWARTQVWYDLANCPAVFLN